MVGAMPGDGQREIPSYFGEHAKAIILQQRELASKAKPVSDNAQPKSQENIQELLKVKKEVTTLRRRFFTSLDSVLVENPFAPLLKANTDTAELEANPDTSLPEENPDMAVLESNRPLTLRQKLENKSKIFEVERGVHLLKVQALLDELIVYFEQKMVRFQDDDIRNVLVDFMERIDSGIPDTKIMKMIDPDNPDTLTTKSLKARIQEAIKKATSAQSK